MDMFGETPIHSKKSQNDMNTKETMDQPKRRMLLSFQVLRSFAAVLFALSAKAKHKQNNKLYKRMNFFLLLSASLNKLTLRLQCCISNHDLERSWRL